MTTAFYPSAYSNPESVSYPRQGFPPLFIFLLSLVYLGINFIYAPLSIAFGCVLVIYIIWKARPEYLPALLILQTNRSDYVLAGYGTWDHSVDRFFDNAILIGGFPVSISHVLAAAVFARVAFEFIQRPKTYSNSGLIWLIVPMVIGFVLATVMTYQAYVLRNPSWTNNIRGFMMFSSLFYGMVLMRSWRGEGEWLYNGLVPLMAVLFGLASLGLFHHHNLWLLSGLAIPLAWLAFKRSSIFGKVAAIFCVFGVTAYSLGLAPGIARVAEHRQDMAGGILGTGTATFTLNAIILTSILVTFIAIIPYARVRKFLSWFMGTPAFLSVFVFSLGVAIASPYFTSAEASGWRVSAAEMSPVERFQAKVFDDRSIIWNGVLIDIIESDPVVRATGTPVIIDHPRHGSIAWTPGAHNGFLEALRAHRWIGGSIVILFLFIIARGSAQVIGKPIPSSLRATAAGLIAFGLIINASGHMHISGETSFWYFTLSGIVIAAIAEVKARAKAGLHALPG